jgi:hypothetical protein
LDGSILGLVHARPESQSGAGDGLRGERQPVGNDDSLALAAIVPWYDNDRGWLTESGVLRLASTVDAISVSANPADKAPPA